MSSALHYRLPERVLLIEDNDDHVWMFQRVMGRVAPPVAVDVAINGEAALAYLAGPTTPDLIFTDINLGRMNGLEVIEQVRGWGGPAARVPVIVLTNSRANRDILRAYDVAVAAYLTKPPQQAELQETLGRVIGLYERAELATQV